MPKDYSKKDSGFEKGRRVFTDREEPQKVFWDRFNSLDENRQSVVNYYGVGGIGKSSLIDHLVSNLRKLRHVANEKSDYHDCAIGYVNFQDVKNRDRNTAIFNLRSYLHRYGDIAFPNFDIAYAHYYQVAHPEVSTTFKMSSIIDRLNRGEIESDAIHEVLDSIPGLDYIWKSGNILSKLSLIHI